MKKPVKHKREDYDYHECQQYIEHKLGIANLRDVDGHCGPNGNPEAEYKDFWYCLCDVEDVHNGCYVYIDLDYNWPDWAIPIVEAFEEEFGHDQYWVSW